MSRKAWLFGSENSIEDELQDILKVQKTSSVFVPATTVWTQIVTRLTQN